MKFQVTQLTETPRVWDSQQQFLEQVNCQLIHLKDRFEG